MYVRKTPIAYAHRQRLFAIVDTFKQHVPSPVETWADFGSAGGFVIGFVMHHDQSPARRIIGFDHQQASIDLGKRKGLPNTEFRHFELNAVAEPAERYDLVTCFETLEHVGDAHAAVTNLCNHVAPGGLLIVTIPIETGFMGTLKFWGRKMARRNPYGDFFEGKSRASYLWKVATNQSLDGWREPGQFAYGPHLGFDYRSVVSDLRNRYVKGGEFTEVHSAPTKLRTSYLVVLRRSTT